MIVVSDTTPLISLMKINRLDLLRELFSEVMIPFAVYDELTSNPRLRLRQVSLEKAILYKSEKSQMSALCGYSEK